ncbi:proline-rich receptor-like protein kinase PERK9 [Iris pallida]|uniref:Proline-rich receptor-like protein kinase PERK9 n=1 Tax=Iris pallida TaxID=29817 RepID=A0AAX6G7S4_IRIPA|nr:proline-rich receptor-like protein kinase PERK9 [Iris pallida]
MARELTFARDGDWLDEGAEEVSGWIGTVVARRCATLGNGSIMAKSIVGVWICGRLLGLIDMGLKGGRRFFVAAPMTGRPWERLGISKGSRGPSVAWI